MRFSLGLILTLSAFVLVAPAHAQGKKDKAPIKASSRTILADLDLPVKVALTSDPVKFSVVLDVLNAGLERKDCPATISIDDESFREEAPDFGHIYEAEIRLRNVTANTTLHQVLRQAIKQLAVKSAIVIRAGKVEIVPASRATKEYLLNQTFHVEFIERRLDQALEELSELTGVSIVLDYRTKQKAQSVVSARFYDDVALQDAVRLLTDMADLKVVYLVTGIYITTPDHAKVMQKELKDIYEPNVAPMPGFGGPPPMLGSPPPLESPLAPPLPPPLAKRRLDAAA